MPIIVRSLTMTGFLWSSIARVPLPVGCTVDEEGVLVLLRLRAGRLERTLRFRDDRGKGRFLSARG